MNRDGGASAREQNSRSRLRPFAVGTVFVLLASSVLLRSVSGVDPLVAVGSMGVLAALALAIRWRRSRSEASATDADADAVDEDGENSDVWNAIPSRQYDGRHVESGGLARSEQERALEDIQRQADELTDDPSQK